MVEIGFELVPDIFHSGPAARVTVSTSRNCISYKPRVHTAAREEFFVRSALTDCAAFQHSNQVRAANSGEPVGDHEYGAAGHQIVQRVLNEHFRFGVELGGRFVQN